jgi:hypothetical protein
MRGDKLRKLCLPPPLPPPLVIVGPVTAIHRSTSGMSTCARGAHAGSNTVTAEPWIAATRAAMTKLEVDGSL